MPEERIQLLLRLAVSGTNNWAVPPPWRFHKLIAYYVARQGEITVFFPYLAHFLSHILENILRQLRNAWISCLNWTPLSNIAQYFKDHMTEALWCWITGAWIIREMVQKHLNNFEWSATNILNKTTVHTQYLFHCCLSLQWPYWSYQAIGSKGGETILSNRACSKYRYHVVYHKQCLSEHPLPCTQKICFFMANFINVIHAVAVHPRRSCIHLLRVNGWYDIIIQPVQYLIYCNSLHSGYHQNAGCQPRLCWLCAQGGCNKDMKMKQKTWRRAAVIKWQGNCKFRVS